jgi:6-pyruvoyltetrahydropterin/6-carboxytetrahydropterin synthase
MFEASVSGKFVAAHQLRLASGALEPTHYHTWRVTVTFVGRELDQCGVLLDFDQIKPRLDELLALLFDRHLNELPAFAGRNPSAENVAKHIAEQLGGLLPEGVQLSCVEVQEAPGCVARYRPGGNKVIR